MISINLLGIKKEIRKAPGAGISMEGAKLTGMLLGFLALAVLFLGGHWFYLNREAARLERELRVEEQEKKRLEGVKAQYDQMERLKAQVKKRLDVIDTLVRSKTGPVEMLSSLSNTVQASGTLWLTNFENTGDKIRVEGVAGSVNAVADFIGNLKRSGHFKNVEILESYQDDRVRDTNNFIFQLTAEQVLPGVGTGKPKT